MKKEISIKAVLSICVSLVGFVPTPFSLLAFPLAIFFGRSAIKDVENGKKICGKKLGKVGFWLGVIGIIFLIIVFIAPSGM